MLLMSRIFSYCSRMSDTERAKIVYIAAAQPDRHKIGISLDPISRLAALSGAAGYRLTLVATYEADDAAAVERVAHWLLRESRQHGEWFGVDCETASAAVRNAIELVKSGFYGPATRVAAPRRRDMRSGAASSRPHNRLTVKSVQAIQKPGMHADGAGLYLKVDPQGARRWVFVFFWAGRRREMGLGPLHTVSLHEARDQATEARRMVRNGVDPIADRAIRKLDAQIAA